MTERATPSAISALADAGCLAADPLPWVLDSAEPWARWYALTEVLGHAADHPDAVSARTEVVASPLVAELIGELPAWGHSAGDHHSPHYAPNRLGLLADMGVRTGDDARVDELAHAMLDSRDRAGRFVVPQDLAARPKPERGAVTCDAAAVVDVLVRLGLDADERVAGAMKRLVADASHSPQGMGWRCMPQSRPLIDLSARRTDACPQVTLESVRALAHVPTALRPGWASRSAATLLEFWRRRSDERPYDFGHGYQFKAVKWPPFWYDALSVLDAVSHYPELWSGPESSEADRAAIAELAAVLIAHNVDEQGRVAPVRTYRGFERFSFGRRGEPSPYATARVVAVLARVADLAAQIAAIDVAALPASRPLSAKPAEGQRPTPHSCPVPQRRAYEASRVLPRVLARHHIGTPWEPASIESLTTDLVGLVVNDPQTPYLSLAARMDDFDAASLDRALDERGSLVRFRCMRGVLYAVRRDMVPVVHAASSRQVVRWARDFVTSRGIDAADYEALSERVLNATVERALTTAELRDRLRPRVDLAAVVTLMLAEARLVRCAARDGRFGRHWTYAPFETVLPDVSLGRLSEDDARATLLRAYVRGFGPVTARDAAWWTGMDLKRVRRAFDQLEDELVEVGIEGREGTWLMHAADAEELERSAFSAQPVVSLLPPNDPLLISYTDRSRFVSDAIRPLVFDESRNVTSTVLVNGRIRGIWDARSMPGPEVLVYLLAEVPRSVREEIAIEARRVGEVRLGQEPRITFVDRVTPLHARPVGAYMHPLR